MNRLLFYIALFFLSTQIGLSEGIDSLKWIKMPVKTYPDYPVQIHDIDSSCFFRHKITYKSYTSSIPYVKSGRTIKVRCKNKTYKFKDSRSEGEQEYFVEGSYNNWIIIKAYLYYNYEQFYFINVKSGEIDSLAGEPLFYDNKILCFEGDNTDGTKMMEVWQIMDEKIFLIYSADLKRRRIYSIDDYYLRNDTVFLRTGERYLKLYYGGPWGDASTNQGFQPFKYNSKELDRMHGLDWYDYGARRYDPAYCLFTQMDPLAEKYPHLSPYVYCAGNPVRYVDPDGMRIVYGGMTDEEELQWKSYLDNICKKSDLFSTLFHQLEDSKDNYVIRLADLSANKGSKNGFFEANDAGGGTITFSNDLDRRRDAVTLEEFFHAYQHDNRDGYGKGEFNREFEAKTFVVTAALGEGVQMMYGEYAGMNDIIDPLEKGYYKDNNFALSPGAVTSVVFNSLYKTIANKYGMYNASRNRGRSSYHKKTTVPPYSLIKIILDTNNNWRH